MRRIHQRIDGVVYANDEAAARYFASGSWFESTLGDLLRDAARRHGDRLAFVSDERSVTFRELDERTERIAAGLLRLGFRPGNRALFQLGTTVETVEALLACFKAGIVPVCSVPQYREIEMGQLAALSDAVGHFVQVDFSAFDMVTFAKTLARNHPALVHRILVRGGSAADGTLFEDLGRGIPLEAARAQVADVRIGCEDVLSFQLSGGTTGVPKIIPRFHAEYIGHARDCARRFGYATDRGASIWNLPLIHNAGQLYVLVPCLVFGRTVHLHPRVDIPAFCAAIEKHRITHAASIGPLAPQLIAYPELARHDFSSIELFVTMTRADSLEQILGVPAVNLYGITEGLLLGLHPSDPVEARHRTNGRSCSADDEIRVLEPDSEREVPLGTIGELCFRGPSSLRAYYGAERETRAALTSECLVRTGDMVIAREIEGERYYVFQGRLRDNINRGGEKYGCEEVEALVSRHPAIADAKIVAMPDPVYGEKGCAFVIPRSNSAVPNVRDLAAFLVQQGLAKFKCPERIEIVAEFPVTRVGKLDKPALKRRIAEQLDRERAGDPR
jgi:non-ribosomal peptide synthetase component E (peptide arylation enzyme)